MTEYLPLFLLAISGMAFAVIVLLSRVPLLLTVMALGGTSAGLYLSDQLGFPPNLIKIYLSGIFAAGFLLLGRVGRFKTQMWEYFLLLFFVGRVLLDFVRPDFDLRYLFGGVGDGLFLTTTYFYFKKTFVARPEATVSLLRAMLYASVAIGLFGLYEGVSGTDLFGFRDPRFMIEGRHRANSIFGAPEFFGAAMALSIYLAMQLYWMGRLRRVTMLGLSSILFLAMVASLYRGIWVAFAAGAFLLFVARPGPVRQLRVTLRIATSVIIAAVVVFPAQSLLKNTAIYQERIANPENVDSRMKVYAAIARGVMDHPWIGYGTGTMVEYLSVTPHNPTDLNTPHNGYLAIVFENGVVLLAIYLGWFIALLLRIRGTNRPATLVAGAMATMVLVTDMTMHFPLSSDYHSLLVVIAAALAMAEPDTPVQADSRPFQSGRAAVVEAG